MYRKDHIDTARPEARQHHERSDDDWPEPTEDQMRRLAALTASSIRTSRLRIDGALAMPCPLHGARPGMYCWHGPSRVRGLCSVRYTYGAGNPAKHPRGDFDALAEFAHAARQVQRAARTREVTR